MEKAFIVKKESEYYKALENYKIMAKKQREFVNIFFDKNGIESNSYRVGGDGRINRPFDEYEKTDINLYIIPTEKDIAKFEKILSKPYSQGERRFRKNSKLLKEFAQCCVDNEVVINLDEPCLRNYFKSLGWGRYRMRLVQSDGCYYLKVSSELLKDDDIPNGFEEIRLSEFYKFLERYENKN